jgi:hypothetical protein
VDFIRTPRQAEFNAVARMRTLGYLDAHVCEPGADGGVDAISERALGQVKHRGAQVGRPDIQRLYGARGDRTHLDLLFFSAGGYSRHAVEYADEAGIMLFTYDISGELAPANSAASALAENGYDGFESPDDEYVDDELSASLEMFDSGLSGARDSVAVRDSVAAGGPDASKGRPYFRIGLGSAVLGSLGLVAAQRWSLALGLLLWSFALFCWIVAWGASSGRYPQSSIR